MSFFWLIIVSVVIGIIILLSKQTSVGEQQVCLSMRAIAISQIAFFYEENRFATSIEELRISDKLATDNYDYSIVLKSQAAFNYAIPRPQNLKSYVAGVYLNPFSTNQLIDQAPKKPQIPTILCEANFNGRNKPQLPTIERGVLHCGKGTTQI